MGKPIQSHLVKPPYTIEMTTEERVEFLANLIVDKVKSTNSETAIKYIGEDIVKLEEQLTVLDERRSGDQRYARYANNPDVYQILYGTPAGIGA